eukprot:CAMPEP_0174257522 /NCGR_PEP_ID=MMETSP0439-20130205/6640_1 /TAXON_ID=0 /ORGANISM="Stereomyxa ramosa, Strain Chinc5" /LENGTH=225 /DNA_ID=CAMNT_0015340627 /DNA_START=45 /DNA_END=719 /DNA_ORIENTATION=-
MSGVITQVDKSGNYVSTTKKSRKSWWESLVCCVNPKDPGMYVNENNNHKKQQTQEFLLAPLHPDHKGKKTLVLDLDETLVHSSFKPVNNADFIIPIEIDDQTHQVYVLKRPGVDKFMRRMGELYEVVIFTASLAKYADPVLDLLDKDRISSARLFREACVNHKGNFVKDLSRLGRDLKSTIIIDNAPASYLFHPNHAIPVESWFDDMLDTELYDLISFLEDLSKV